MDQLLFFFNIFILVLSSVFLSKYIFSFIMKLFQDNPEPLKINNYEELLILLAVTNILTNLICYIIL